MPLTEEAFKKSISRLEEIYSNLIKGDTNPSIESEFRVEIIDVLSTIEASLISDKINHKEFRNLLKEVRDSILEWNPGVRIFQQNKKLVDDVNSLIVNGKKIVLTSSNMNNSEANRLKDELNALKSELNDLRSLMSDLVKAKSVVTAEQSPISEDIKEEDTETEPPLILPVDDELHEETDEILETFDKIESTESYDELILESLPIEDEESLISAEATIKKLTEKRGLESSPASMLSKMKTILDEAEQETEKQISSFKEKLIEEKAETIDIEEQLKDITPEIESDIQPKPDEVDEITEISEQLDESLVKPSEILKQQESTESSIIDDADPYIQL